MSNVIKCKGFTPRGPVHIIRPAKPSMHTMEFPTYNEAIQYARKVSGLNPSKPYKRIKGASAPVWAVSFVNASAIRAKADSVRFATVPGYTGIGFRGYMEA